MYTTAAHDDISFGSGRRPPGSGRPPVDPPTPRAPLLQDVPVLIVEDDAPSAKLVSVVLRGEGCAAPIVPSAEAALQLLASYRPRVIVIDLVLPLMGGLLLAQTLKADPTTKDIVLIAVTAFNGSEAERIARQAGFAAYVRKPIDPLTFASIVRDQLEGAP